MAQLLLINSETQNLPWQDIDDIVGVYRDKHIFSPREKVAFNIVNIKGSREDVQKKFQDQRPETTLAFQSKSTGQWSLEEPMRQILHGPS